MSLKETKCKYQCILTDHVNRKVIDIVKGRESHILSEYFNKLSNNDCVKFVVIDMWKPYLEIVKGRESHILSEYFIISDKLCGILIRFVKTCKRGYTLQDVSILNIANHNFVLTTHR